MNSIAMKLKYKRCLKSAQASVFRVSILADTLNAQQKPRLVCLGVLRAVWARRVDPEGCWCLLLTVSSIFTNHRHPPATHLTSETTNQNQRKVLETKISLRDGWALNAEKIQRETFSLFASSEVSMALISVCSLGRHQIWADLQWSAFTLGLRAATNTRLFSGNYQ